VECISFVLALLIFTFFVCIPIFTSLFLSEKQEAIYQNIDEVDHCYEYNTLLPVNLEDKIPMKLNFYPIFLVKRILFVMTMIALTSFKIV